MNRLTRLLTIALMATPLLACDQSVTPGSSDFEIDEQQTAPIKRDTSPRQNPTSTETQPKRTFLV